MCERERETITVRKLLGLQLHEAIAIPLPISTTFEQYTRALVTCSSGTARTHNSADYRSRKDCPRWNIIGLIIVTYILCPGIFFSNYILRLYMCVYIFIYMMMLRRTPFFDNLRGLAIHTQHTHTHTHMRVLNAHTYIHAVAPNIVSRALSSVHSSTDRSIVKTNVYFYTTYKSIIRCSLWDEPPYKPHPTSCDDSYAHVNWRESIFVPN